MLMAGSTGADLFHMASRTKQKEEARARRLAEEQARAEQSRRMRRLQMLGGVVILAIIVVVVAVIVSSGGGNKSHVVTIKGNKHQKQSQIAKLRQQGAEDTGYVNQDYLNTLAQQIPGLNFSKWQTDSRSQTLLNQVRSEEQAAAGAGYNSTPTIVITGPKGQAPPIPSAPSGYAQL